MMAYQPFGHTSSPSASSCNRFSTNDLEATRGLA
jgi:hypothetical protein